jgi:hypothetical protein
MLEVRLLRFSLVAMTKLRAHLNGYKSQRQGLMLPHQQAYCFTAFTFPTSGARRAEKMR